MVMVYLLRNYYCMYFFFFPNFLELLSPKAIKMVLRPDHQGVVQQVVVQLQTLLLQLVVRRLLLQQVRRMKQMQLQWLRFLFRLVLHCVFGFLSFTLLKHPLTKPSVVFLSNCLISLIEISNFAKICHKGASKIHNLIFFSQVTSFVKSAGGTSKAHKTLFVH